MYALQSALTLFPGRLPILSALPASPTAVQQP
jgi:hypothetical protein